MKKNLLLILLFLNVKICLAQKFAYVDSKYILEKIPAYIEAKEELDNLSFKWAEEIEALYENIDQMYKKYQIDKLLLTQKMKQTREDEIIKAEEDVKQIQQTKFGPDGELYKKQEELIRPIQNQIYDAINQYAKDGRYSIIFDKSSELLMLYADKNLDKSDQILEILGYNY